jgi:hypothetical protein
LGVAEEAAAVATIASLLREHVTLQVRSVDRLFLQAYVPRLMTPFQVVRFLLDRGHPIPSPALLGKIGRAYVAAIDRYAERHRVPVLRFGKGESKEQIARRYFRAAERDGRFGVVLIGVAQEKTTGWRGWRQGGSDGHPHFEFACQAIFVNHSYFYIRDPDWGPAFIKTCAYAPSRPGSISRGMSGPNARPSAPGSRSRRSTTASARSRTRARWRRSASACPRAMWSASTAAGEARLPSALTPEDRRRGYGHQLCFRQLELSDTRVFDRAAAGRAWFEQTLRDQLTLGRPAHAAIVFGRRITSRTPGRFSYARDQPRQRTGDPGPLPRLQGQAVPQGGPALRTETTVNDTYDFGIGRLLTEANWDALLRVGHDINERLLDAQLQACACAPDAAALERIVLPSRHDGQPAPALHFGDPRVMALLASLRAFSPLLEGLTNRCLRDASPN